MTANAALQFPLIAAALAFGLACHLPADATLQALCPQSKAERTTFEVLNRNFMETPEGLAEASDDSTACMECHDGTTAKAVFLMQKGPDERNRFAEPAAAYGMLNGNHPVNVLYPDSSPDFVPLSQLDPALRLHNGQVVCSTCHPFGAQLPNDRSRLCLSCHIK